ncbi:TPA: hypothetical protein ACH3X1_008277 [Trebouxia sp. C0004]
MRLNCPRLLQTSRHERAEAEQKLNKLTADNDQLVQRLVEMKATEVERMNEVNRTCDEMLKSARSMERQAAQQAQQSANSLRHTSSILRTPSLSGALRGMRIRGGETGGEGAAPAAATPVPEKATKSVPAHDGGCFTCAFDRSGTHMATGGADKVVKLWDPATGANTGSLRGMLDTILEVSFTADQKHLLAAGGDQALRMWDITSGRVRHTLTGHTGKVSSVDCSPSSSLRAVSSGTDRTIKVWDLNKGYCLRTIMCHSSCNSVRCTRDEHLICSGHFDGTLRFWDIRSGNMANEVTGLHTQQICSVQIGARDGKQSLCTHVCQNVQVCSVILLTLLLYSVTVALVILLCSTLSACFICTAGLHCNGLWASWWYADALMKLHLAMHGLLSSNA